MIIGPEVIEFSTVQGLNVTGQRINSQNINGFVSSLRSCVDDFPFLLDGWEEGGLQAVVDEAQLLVESNRTNISADYVLSCGEEAIGGAGVAPSVGRAIEPYIFLAPSWRRRGIGRAAMQALPSIKFSENHTLSISVKLENEAALRLLGMREVSEMMT